LDGRLAIDSSAMIMKPKINPRKIPPINIAMAMTPFFLLP
jgi:hypothetical protein